jgi:hypothetical protein
LSAIHPPFLTLSSIESVRRDVQSSLAKPLMDSGHTLEFNPDLGRQIVPMMMEIIDNVVLNRKASRFQNRIQKLAPRGLIMASQSYCSRGCNARDHHRHGDLPSSTYDATLPWPVPKRRDGHHKNAVFAAQP